MRVGRLCLAVCALSLAGCAAGSPLFPGDPSLALESERYRVVLEQWTKQQKVYRHFEAKIFATASYLSPDLRQAYIRRRTRVLGLPPSEIRLLEAEHADRARRYHEFIVSIYTGERRWNDLDAADSMWRVSLRNDHNQEVSPTEVKRQDLRSGDLRAYFPYISVFQQAYLVRFPRTILELNVPVIGADVRRFSLRFLSGVAVAELSWSLDRPLPGPGAGG